MTPPIKKTDEGYFVSERFFQWAVIAVLGAGGSGIAGIASLPKMISEVPDRWTGTAQHKYAGKRDVQVDRIVQRVRANERLLSRRDARIAGVSNRVTMLDDKVDDVRDNVISNGLILQKILTTLEYRK